MLLCWYVKLLPIHDLVVTESKNYFMAKPDSQYKKNFAVIDHTINGKVYRTKTKRHLETGGCHHFFTNGI